MRYIFEEEGDYGFYNVIDTKEDLILMFMDTIGDAERIVDFLNTEDALATKE